MGDNATEKVAVIPSGSLGLDIALGVGGYARGRSVEIFGPEASGKTTIALMAVAEAQRMKQNVVYIDAEHALDPAYAGRLGVSVDDMYLSQPSTAEEALDLTDQLVRSGEVGLVVIDSVAALTPKAELEGEIGDSHMGLMARLMSQSLRMITANMQKTNTTVIFLNQIRMQIGVMFGNPETTTGGRALRFYASQRLDVRRVGTIKEKEVPIGSNVKIKVIKNKVAVPFRTATFDLIWGQGVDKCGEIFDLGQQLGLVTGKGWYEYDGLKAQGKQNLITSLVEADKIDKLKGEILDKVKSD